MGSNQPRYNGYLHLAQVHKTCSQACKGCGIAVVRLGPTHEEATIMEKCIALPALCMACAGGTQETQRVDSKVCVLAQPAVADKPGKASAAMIRELAKRKSMHPREGAGKERFTGDMTEGLYPGDSGIFRMSDDTLALKCNKDGIITKKPVCGHWFTELDGSHSIYEWGEITQRDVS
jgi:hypothetical protein